MANIKYRRNMIGSHDGIQWDPRVYQLNMLDHRIQHVGLQVPSVCSNPTSPHIYKAYNNTNTIEVCQSVLGPV